MSIPFTQYLRPHGEKRASEIDMPEEIEALAQTFIAAGGRYESEVLREGTVSLTAAFTVDGEDQDIAIELCGNNHGVPAAVERLVRASVEKLNLMKEEQR